jgi:curved DNA-binding protein CbpA
MLLPNYYAALEISKNASLEEIKQSYRRLVRLYHPDVSKQQNDRRIKQLNEAYKILSDPVKRTQYDIQCLEEHRHILMLESLILQRRKKSKEQQITWRQGVVGFIRELKKNVRDE